MAALSATWSRITTSDRLRRSSQSLAVSGSQAWIFGGELKAREPIDNHLDFIQLSDGTTNATIDTLPAPDYAPSPRVGSSLVSLGNDLYLFSGRGGLEMKPIEENGSFWRYSTSDSSWDTVKPADESAPYPAGRSYHAMTSDGHDSIYVSAGCPEQGRLSDLWQFNINSRVWTQFPNAPLPGRGGSSLAFSNGKLYRMNGFDGTEELGGCIDVFDPSTKLWSTLSFEHQRNDGPEPRSVAALVAVSKGGQHYLVTLFGERDPSNFGHAGAGKMLSDVWMFDIENRQWMKVETKGEQPKARGWFDADVVGGDKGNQAILVHGGLAEDNSRLGDVWVLQF